VPVKLLKPYQSSNSVILVGLKDSKIVACVHVEKDRSNSHIGMLAVNPALQGAGAGKQMLFHFRKMSVSLKTRP
jgi:N-acetylglutamate synthase-like GNAT family acetyltransferase